MPSLPAGRSTEELENACQGRTFAQPPDQPIISVFRAAGIRLSALAGNLHEQDDPLPGDVDLWRREMIEAQLRNIRANPGSGLLMR